MGFLGPVKHPLEHQWLIGSGASNHMTRERMLLADFKEQDPPEKVGLGDGRTVDAVGVGNVKVKMDLQSKEANGLKKQRGNVCCTIWSFICT